MRRLGSVFLCLLVLALVGCPKRVPLLASPDGVPGTASEGPAPAAGVTPAPRPDPLPSPFTLPLNSRAMTVKPVDLPNAGEVKVPIEAQEAILVLSRTGDTAADFGFAFDGATTVTSGMPSLQSLPPAPGPACGTFERPLAPMGTVPTASGFQTLRVAFDPPVVGARREFFVRSVPVRAVCVAVGTHGAIWVDERDQVRFSAQDLLRLNQNFDALFPRLSEQYGEGPLGRADGYNWGDDRLNFLISQQVPAQYGGFVEALDFFPDSFTQERYGMRSNYAKVLYLNSIYGSAHFLNTMVHEVVHIIFYAHRLAVYSLNHGKGLPLGQDSSYFGAPDQAERWLNEGMAVLSEYLFGTSPDVTYRSYLQRYLDAPSAYDMEDFLRAAEQDPPNYGGALLFAAYAQSRHGAFVKEVQMAAGVSTAAVDEVMQRATQRSYAAHYRDYALSVLLDGYHPDVPEAYRIPHVDVTGGFGGAQLESVTRSAEPPRPNGVRYVHVRFESGKGALRVWNAGNLRATLLLVTPAEAPAVTGG